jgi:alpha-1,2-mannosyltransferase
VRDKLYDFNLYYIAAAGFGRGVDIYALADEYATTNRAGWADLAAQHEIQFYAPPYRYPPLTAQLVLPLTRLPPRIAGLIWLACTAAAFVVSAWLMGKSSHRAYGVPLAYLLLLAFVPPLTTMHAGQVNGFVLLTLSLALCSLTVGNWAGTGVALGLATLLKLTPLALLFYLPWRGWWKATIAAALTIVVALTSAALMFGVGALRSYGEHFLVMGQPGTVFVGAPNQSWNGFWGRLLANRAHTAVTYRLYLITAALTVLGTVACCWPVGRLRSQWELEFGLVVCALQLITPYTWYHQFSLLLIPLFVLLCRVLSGRAPRWWLIALGVGLAGTDLHGLLWHQIAEPALLSIPFYTALTLWGMVAFLLVQDKGLLTRPRQSA